MVAVANGSCNLATSRGTVVPIPALKLSQSGGVTGRECPAMLLNPSET